MSEPVAWRTLVDGKSYVTDDNEFVVKMWQHNGWKEEPLYTHPVKELTDEVIEQVRVAIMGAAYWCADENMPEAYNAVKVCCGQVLGILDKAQEK